MYTSFMYIRTHGLHSDAYSHFNSSCQAPVLFIIMAERDAKLRRLNAFRRRRPHITANALAETLKAVEEEGLPELHNRNQLRESRDHIASETTPFGPIVQDINVEDTSGRMMSIPIASPFAMLWVMCMQSAAFAALMKQRLEVCPTSYEHPWNVILYSDEVTPGNPLKTANERKFQAVYFSFLELGPHALSSEQAWMPLMTEYSTVVNRVQGSLSHVFGAIVKYCFSAGGFSFQLAGINLPLGDGVRFWAKLGLFVQDGAAHKYTWSSRAGACRLCLLCKNVFTEQSEVVAEDGSNLLCCNVYKVSDCNLATSRDLRAAARYLERKASTLTATAFTSLQQSLGLTYIPGTILLDRDLDTIVDPAEQYVHDWMHTLFADGIANLLVYLLFEEFIKQDRRGIYDLFMGFANKWVWPKNHYSAHLPKIFAAHRKDSHRKAHHVKCQASDMMSLLPVLAYFVQSILLPTNLCNEYCEAFLAMCDMCEFITSVNRGRITPAALRGKIEHFLALMLACWGAAYMIPKMHWLLHLPAQFERWGTLFACFVNERFHKFPKQYATEIQNTSNDAGRSLLKEVVCHCMANVSAPGALNFDVHLVHPRTANQKELDMLVLALELSREALTAADVKTSLDVRFNVYGTCHVGDVVLIRSHDHDGFVAARVVINASIANSVWSLVNEFKLKSLSREAGYSEWHSGHNPMLIESRDILDTVMHTNLSRNVVGVLLPCEFR